MKRAVWIALLLAFIVHPALADDKYIFIMKAIGNPYWQALKEGIEDASKKAGVTPILMYPISDLAKEEDLNLCQSAITQKPRIIVMGAETTSIGLECYKQAQAQGILVADMDATISVDLAKKSGVDLQYSIGADNTLIGEKAAAFVAAHFKDKNAAPKILIIEGAVGSPPGQDRPIGFKRKLASLLPKAEIVNSLSAEWDRLRAMNITADTLMRTPDLNVIFAANDVMALGAVEAVRAAGKQGQVMIIGVDGIPDARKAVKDGLMTASITQLPYFIGKRTAELAFDAVQGKKIERTESAPLLVLTKEVLAANKDPLLTYVR
ncbi:MAG: substrate-binding domain-containing protein [Alphaproteobacteria bacterium]|nr:substrate-binding domain-containing protein [Alphaproteobacteria bacterium]